MFSRSELRRSVVDAAVIQHYAADRPRVTKWVRCAACSLPTPKYQAEVDHCIPIVPIDKSLEEMTWDQIVGRIFCSRDNLDVLCKPCHKIKTKDENKRRREAKARKKLALNKK